MALREKSLGTPMNKNACTVENIHGCDIVSDPNRLGGVMTPTDQTMSRPLPCTCHIRYQKNHI